MIRRESEVAQTAANIYKDDEVAAVYLKLARGEIDALEAAKLMKQNKADDFNENMRKINEMTNMIDKLKETGMFTEDQINGKSDMILNHILGNVTNNRIEANVNTTKQINQESSNQGEEGLYEPSEDDE